MDGPVVIQHDRDHPFVKRPTRGCAQCGGAKDALVHHGAPPSMNALGSGNRQAFQRTKSLWQTWLGDALAETGLEGPLGHVLAEGEVTFPDKRGKRDQGNHRFFIEKALGDALVKGGWLLDDDWDSYEFGGLSRRYEKGVSRLRLMVFPTPPEE
jgi:hypothetical protein